MILISVGSNVEPEHNIFMAEERLRGLFSAIRFSRTIISDAIGMPEGTPQYGNAIVQVFMDPRDGIMPLPELEAQLKLIEYTMGRRDEDKAEGRVVIDLDILLYETQLFRPDDWHRPYNQTLLEEMGL